jgi:hypothetical protein
MDWVAINESSGARLPVRFCHYWKGRQFNWHGPVPIPEFIIRKFYNLGSKYATYARVEVDKQVEVSAYALCMKDDQPQRCEGRLEALKKLDLPLHLMGLELHRLEQGGRTTPLHDVIRERDRLCREREQARKDAIRKAQVEGISRQAALERKRAWIAERATS